MKSRVLLLIASLALTGAAQRLSGADGTQPPLPIPGESAPLASALEPAFEVRMASEALRIGLARDAAERAGRVLADAGAAQALRAEAAQVASLAQLALGDGAASLAILESWPGGRNDRWWLRRGLVASLARDAATLADAISRCDAGGLPEDERPWLPYLRGVAAEMRGDFAGAQAAFAEALGLPMQRATFARMELRMLQNRLASGESGPEVIDQLRNQVREFSGRQVGWQAAQQLAAVLIRLGRTAEAVDLLSEQQSVLPPEDPGARDRCLLLIGLADGATGARGRPALARLAQEGSRNEWQQAALQLLADAPGDRRQLRSLLDTLARATPAHPLRTEALLLRAAEHFTDGAYVEADEILSRLLASQLTDERRREALLLRARVSWRQSRFLTAASALSELRNLTLSPGDRALLGLLVADALYSSGDFANAADAYAASWTDAPDGIQRGGLLFQRVLAELGAERPERAAAALDAAAGDRSVDLASLWRAEWNLLKHLQSKGRTSDAILRLDARQSPEVFRSLPVELAIRYRWLRAELALASGQAAEAVIFAESIPDLVRADAAGRLPEVERSRILSAARLLAVEGLIAQRRLADGREGLERLRADFPGSDAARQSYLVEARQLADSGDAAGAEAVLIRLADLYPDSEYTVQALYEAALLAERRGAPSDLDVGVERLERLARHPSAGTLLIFARMKQGDLLRKRDNFAAAQSVYESIVNDPRFAAHPARPTAEVALADVLLAQRSAGDAGFATASGLLERVFDLQELPADLRIEAAVKLASALVARERVARAEETFLAAWTRFGTQAEALSPGGRYWLGRLCLSWAEWLERRNRIVEARAVYERLAALDVPGRQIAEARLRRPGGN